MKRTMLFVALAVASSFAIASTCPKLMKQIDDALPSAKVGATQMEEVKKLRAEGEAHHKAGKHGESEAALNKAKGILGIK
ncbi:MAG: hypothetical protein A3I63_07350 [Betaproteobacteria bacterium RIFCSPLOWO2_02_FULL_66_14]|nr:MAG: hypothetical protein A3I63_07350 [Betaproteobacteria bacterium RIFCSPLOWO2_02_FULL_66_14]